MKCPKCGYNTFEYLDSCKKCGKELSAFKESMGIRPLVLQAVAPAVAGIESSGALLQGSGAPESAEDKLFQWDTPESAAEPGMSAMDEFEIPADSGESTEPPKDPFSFDDEFDILGSTQQAEAAAPESEEPFGGFSLDDLGTSSEEPLPDMTSKEETVPQESAFGGFAFDDEEPPAAEASIGEEPPAAAGDDVDDIFGGFSLEEAVSAEEQAETVAMPGEETADSIFGEFSIEDQPPSIGDEPEEPLQASADSIFGEFAFDESAGESSSGGAAGMGLTEILEEKQGSSSAGGGAEFSMDAFADDLSVPTGDGSAAGEFDLDDFLKIEDDPKAAGQPGGGGATSSPEDLDALFGELDLTEKK